MQKLYLVGFTSDLASLIFSRQKGVKSGGFMINVDEGLVRAVEEVVRLQDELRLGPDPAETITPQTERGPSTFRPQGRTQGPPELAEPPIDEPVYLGSADAPPPGRSTGRASRLSPKEIQSQLRAGFSVHEVARQAGTDIAWIERFTGPILAEREGIVEAVRSSVISRPRLGRSGSPVGEAIVANLEERKIGVGDGLGEGWRAVRRGGTWEVTFRYAVRGEAREAEFSFDVETRAVRAANQLASQVGWRPVSPAAPAAESDDGDDAGEAPGAGVAERPATVLTARATPTVRPKAGARRPAAGAGSASSAMRGVRDDTSAVRARATRVRAEASDPPAAGGPPGRSGGGNGRGGRKVAGRAAATQGDLEDLDLPADRPAPRAPSPRGAGPSDERRSFARSSTSPRPKRLLSETDGADWVETLARKRASRVGGSGGGEPRPTGGKSRPHKKRIPDDWLLEP